MNARYEGPYCGCHPLPDDLAVSLNVCPPCAQALHDLCTRALAPCDCPEHEGEDR